MATLVTMDQARAHILLPPFATGSPASEDENDQRLKLDAAEAIILDYLDTRADVTWTAETVPTLVKAAILIQFAELVRFRGDEQKGEGPEQTDGNLSPSVTNILRRFRDPVLK
jgi:hypothetical protein